MARLKSYVISGAVLAGAAAFVWYGLLDERAHKSLGNMASKSGALAQQLVDGYMNPEGVEEKDEIADQANREWIAYQWKQIGY